MKNLTRRQVQQTLDGYARAVNHRRSECIGYRTRDPEPHEIQKILDGLRAVVGTAKATDIPAIAAGYLPVSPDKIIVVFDNHIATKHDDYVTILITTTHAEVRWYDAHIVTRRGCR